MKHVLEIINLPSSAINFIGGQFKYLREEGGYDMHLICSPGGGIESFCQENRVHYHPIELRRKVSVWRDVIALWKICKYIKTNHIDIVIAHQPKARLLGMIACVLTRVKHRIIFSHGILYETMTGVKRWLIMQNEKIVSSLATRVVCVSHYVKDQRIKDGVDKPLKQVILGRGSCNGIDTINKFNPQLIDKDLIDAKKNHYGINCDDFVIGFCGRLVKDKGVIELVEAFEELKGRHIDKHIKLLVVGEPEIRDSLPSQTIAFLKESKDVIFTGPIPYNEIQEYYILMDVLVLPTHRDGLGLVAIEASAMERPVIVSDFTGSAETIEEGITGLYIDKTPHSIVITVEKCFDKDFAKQLGQNGRKFVCEYFEHTEVRKHVLKLLDEL